MKKLEVCISSLNPIKIEAVKMAFDKYFDDYKIVPINTDSKVPKQPIGMDIILKGAFNRATNAFSYLNQHKNEYSDIYGVGIEAGLVNISLANSKYMDFQFCVIIDKNKEITLGSGIAFEYPQFVIDEILSEKKPEIGEIFGKLSDNKNIKNENGAIGFLSNNIINRRDILYQAVICALLPRINKNLYLNFKK
ncbi:MAG: inosine/xanthosine triphosphatase [Candidatus Lokiarchaeota archaeon]|nr:inosine/xanthosine triphosphatase [Candidatus Lokiarchaeota archaeon]